MLVYLSFTWLWIQKKLGKDVEYLYHFLLRYGNLSEACASVFSSPRHTYSDMVIRGMTTSTNLTCIYSVNEKAFRSMKEQFSTFNCSRRLRRRIKNFKKFLSSGFSEVSLVCTFGGAATHGGSLRTKQDQCCGSVAFFNTLSQLSKRSLV